MNTDTDGRQAIAELRQLVNDVRAVTSDGRRMGADLADSILEISRLQCDAIEARLQDVVARLDRLEARQR